MQNESWLEELIEKLKRAIVLGAEAEDFLRSIAKTKDLVKGDAIIRQGQTVRKVYFVTRGCLRSFSVDKNGKEHTLLFAITDWWISDYIAIYTDEHATLTVESLTDSSVIEFDAKRLEEIFTRFPEFEPFQRKVLERHVVSLQKRILNQLQLTATERYDLFLEQYGDIEHHAPNYHIASYLGITQESLSRIRVKKARG